MMTLTAANGEYAIDRDACGDDATPGVELTMTADVAHKFGQVNSTLCERITTHEIGINGSPSKIMRLTR